MKIYAVVAEYNPLHYGHLRLIEHIKGELNAEKLLVVMSGNFCERGETAIMDKFRRARHAIAAGADMVVELPTVFATANAELFATGAVKILKSTGLESTLCFGVESGDAATYKKAAAAMLNESKEFKHALKRELETGVSLAKAKFNAVKALSLPDLDESIISSPNNVLGLEYTKAVMKLGAKCAISPYLRSGDHNDPKLYKGITSAQSIRSALAAGGKKKVKKSVPSYVYADLPDSLPDAEKFIVASVIAASPETIAKASDCTEGLENRIKALVKDNLAYADLVEKVSTKRYTMARVKRILLATFLGIGEDFIFKCLKAPLYLNVLAMRGDNSELLAELKNKATVPVLVRKSDCRDLDKTALECFEKDVTANDLYNLITGEKRNEYYTAII